MNQLLVILTVLSSFFTNLEMKTLKTEFTVTVTEEAAQPLNFPGTITIHGRNFLLEMFNIEAAYDGSTLYMYNPETDELTLTTPTELELYEVNPFLFAKAIAESCTTTEQPVQNNQSPYTLITLTPKDLSQGINRFTLKVRNDDLMPLEASIREGKKTTLLRLTNPAFVPSDTTYVIVPYEKTFVNDMRGEVKNEK